VTDLTHYKAVQGVVGAGSTVTNVRGFWAANAIAVGTNNYGFYSDINSAAATYAFYASGTAQSRFNGPVGILNDPGSALLLMGTSNIHPSAISSVYGAYAQWTAPSTATVEANGYFSRLDSQAAAFTLPNLNHFKAHSSIAGAGSTITSIRGFYAANAIAVGTNNYGFYSDINDATNTFAFYSAGTAASRFSGSVAIGTNNVANASEALRIVLPSTVNAASVVPINLNFAAPATTTTSMSVIFLTSSTAAAAFTCPEINAYRVNQFTLGAGSAVTNLNGFYVNSLWTNDVAGTTVRGYYSLLNKGANAAVWQIYLAGTAESMIFGPLSVGTTTSPGATAGAYLYVGGVNSHPSTLATIFGARMDYTTPSTGITQSTGFLTTMRTAAAAVTYAEIAHFSASSTTLGAGATITAVYGFKVNSAVAVAATNVYGFYVNLSAATGVWAVYNAGTAESYFNGAVSVATGGLAANANGAALLYVGGATTHTNTSNTIYGAPK
jgi:hypothetical protein